MTESLIYQIFEGITVIFETFFVHLYISAFFESKYSKKPLVLGYSVFCAGLIILSLYCSVMLILTVYTAIGLFVLISVLYKSEIASRVFSVALFMVIVMSSDVMCSGIMELFGGIDVNDVMVYGMPRVLFITITKIIEIFIIKVIGVTVKWKRERKTPVEITYVIPFLVCQVLSIPLTHHIVMIGLHKYGYFGLTTFLSIVGILYINLVIFWYFDKIKAALEYKARNEAAEMKLELQTQYYELMEIKQIETDAVRHDMQKHLYYMKSLIESKAHDDAKRYFQELDDQFIAPLQMIATPEPIINTLLTVEKRKAERENVNLSIGVSVYSQLKISHPELGIILSNIFDNAIEACRYISDENDKRIKLGIYQRENMLLIEMENTYIPDAVKKSRLGKHGYGLKNIRKVAGKYGGYVEIKSSDNVFNIKVIIP